MNIKDRLNQTTLRTKSKDQLIVLIQDLYREIDSIVEAIGYIHSDLSLIQEGDAYRVHDNP